MATSKPLDEGLRAEVEASLADFAEACTKGNKTVHTKCVTKIFKDSHLYNKKLTTTDTDIAFSKFCKKGQKGLTTGEFADMCEHLQGKCGKTRDEMLKEVASHRPKAHGATKTSTDDATSRMTDTSKYTGAHKERFDESGKGKGIAGRQDLHANDGYVGGYKNKDSYDAKH